MPVIKYKRKLGLYDKKIPKEEFLHKIKDRCFICLTPIPASVKHYLAYGNSCERCDRKSDKIASKKMQYEREQRAERERQRNEERAIARELGYDPDNNTFGY